MKSSLFTRRSFLKRTLLTSAAVSASGLLPRPNLLAASGSGNKVNCVQIGCGGGGWALIWIGL